jgi:hypothetical protein
MTVGQKLAEITDLKLFHNHMTYELVSNFFNVFETEEGERLNYLFRQEIFEAVAKSDLPGLIFTCMIHFGADNNYDYVTSIIELFESYNAETCVIELYADFEVRIERNKTENRLLNKPSKRDIQASEELFRWLESDNRFNSIEDEILPFKNYLKIDNTNLQPEDVAAIIKDTFML